MHDFVTSCAKYFKLIYVICPKRVQMSWICPLLNMEA